MTRNEALTQLRLGPGISEDVSEEYADAVDIAIKSIEAWDKLFEMHHDMIDKIRAEVLEYIDDLDVASKICDIFDKYKAESELKTK